MTVHMIPWFLLLLLIYLQHFIGFRMLNDSKVVSGVHTCFKALVSSPQGPASTSTNGRIRKTFCAEMMEECVYTQPLLTTVVITSKGFIKAKNAPHSDETLPVSYTHLTLPTSDGV